MTKREKVCLFLAAFGFLGCGGSTPTATQEFLDAMPTLDTVTMDERADDVAAARQGLVDDGEAQQALTGIACHPHLFQRTRAVAKALNRLAAKFLRRTEQVVDNHPKAITGSTHTWVKLIDGDQLSLKVTLTKSSDTQWSVESNLKPASAPDSAFVVFSTATFSKTDGTPHSGSGTMSINLTALNQLLPSVEKALGTITIDFFVSGANKKIRVQLASYTPDDTNPERLPVTANYVFARTAQVGGSFKLKQLVDLACPEQTQVPHQIATLQATHRWIVQSSPAPIFQGRSDAQASGGQIPPNQKFVGITCADLSAPDATAEKYWAMKLEQGTTVVRSESDGQNASTTCNSALGPVPALASTANDYNFALVNFNDASIVPYPGQPTGFN
jgi:hypothetical protein